jgi:hypothetical protein
MKLFDCRNLLLHDAGYLKVADFGLGKLLDASAEGLYEMTGETGTCKLKAPCFICLVGGLGFELSVRWFIVGPWSF